MTCPEEKGERLEVCKGRRIERAEKQEEEAEDFVEAELHYEGRKGGVNLVFLYILWLDFSQKDNYFDGIGSYSRFNV